MLLEYIVGKYKENEPIFSGEIQIPGLTETNLRQQLKNLCDRGSLCRFDAGVYYLPKRSRLGGTAKLPAGIVAKYKYIENNEETFGYYSGYTLANQLGILEQVPVKEEIVSNNIKAIVREVKLGNQSYIVRRSKIPVDKHNQKTLQLLDLLKEFDSYVEPGDEMARHRVEAFVRRNSIRRADVEKYASYFPLTTYKSIFDLRLENVFA